MRRYLLVALLVFALAACAPSQVGVCRHRAVYSAIVMSESYPVRIAVGDAGTGRHAQAQARINGNWQWLKMGPDYWVTVGDQESFTPDQYYTLQAYVALWRNKTDSPLTAGSDNRPN